MAVTLTGTNGLFTRIGAVMYTADIARAHQSAVLSALRNARSDYNQNDIPYATSIVAGEENVSRAAGTSFPTLAETVRTTLIEMVNDDAPLANKTFRDALIELKSQMAASDSINGVEPTTSTTYGGDNTGTGEIILSTKDAYNDFFQYLREEDISLICTTDSQEGAVTEGRELWRLSGEAAVRDTASTKWPGGSGAAKTIRVCDPAEGPGSTPGRSILTNGGFNSFSGHIPTNWTQDVGSSSTVAEENTTVFRGSACLEIIGDGATLDVLSQSFGTPGATVGKLKPETRYSLSAVVRVTSAALAGVLRLSVKDGSNTILASGGAAVSSTLSSLTDDTWTRITADFVTPKNVPSNCKIVVELTTALTNKAPCFVDDVCLAEMELLTPQGLYGLLLPGETPFVRDDEITVAVTSNLYGAKLQYWLERLTGISETGVVLPFSTTGTETIGDSVITGS